MRISILIGKLVGGGAERVVCNLANHLSKKHDVTIVTMVETTAEHNLNDKVKNHILLKQCEKGGKVHNSVLRYKRLREYIREHNFDLFIVMLPLAIFFLLHFRKQINAPIIASERSDPKSYGFFKRWLLSKKAKQVEGWVFQTEDAYDWYKKYMRKAEGKVIPNAINPAFIGKAYFGERKKEIVSAGRLSKQKNFDLLIKAFSDVANDFPDYILKIYGEGPLLSDHKETAKSLNLEARVEFPGRVNDIDEKIKQASLFVLSSDYEGMPNALMEAMALGLPCISTDCPCGGPRFLIENHKNGILVGVKDRYGLATSMRNLLSDNEYAESLGKNAVSVCEILAPEKIYDEWEKFVEKIYYDNKDNFN